MFTKRADGLYAFSQRSRGEMWTLVLLVSMIVIGVHAWLMHQRIATMADQAAKRQQIKSAAAALERKIQSLVEMTESNEARPTLSELEQALNNGHAIQKLPYHPDPTKTSYLWNSPETGVEFRFAYGSAGHLDEHVVRWNTPRNYPNTVPAPSPIAKSFELLRSAFIHSPFQIGVGNAMWITGMLMYTFAIRFRPLLAEVLLALAFLCTIAWLIDPNYQISFQELVNKNALVWGSLMIMSSAFMVRNTRRSDRPNLRLCSKCEYDLTGNVSGICPECGTKIPPRVRDYIGE